jgi:hypothetical protein
MVFRAGKEWNGNKKGRPLNSGHRQQLFSSLVDPYKERLFETAIDLALGGNESMLRLLLDRLLPAKPIDDHLNIDVPETGFTKIDKIVAYGEEVLNKVSSSELTPDQAKTLMSLLESQRKIVETSEIEKRVLEIESTLKQRRNNNKPQKDKKS